MADPFTMAAVGMGAAAGGSILGAFGAAGAGQAQSQTYAYQAGIAKVNATLDRQNASWTEEQGEVASLQSGQKTGFMVSSQKVAQSGSGLDVNTGSAAKVRDSQLEIGQLDQNIIRTSAARRAYGFQIGAATKDAESEMDLTAGANASKTGTIGAITSILGGASSVASKWSQGSAAGVFS